MAKSPKPSNVDAMFAKDAKNLELIRSLVAESDKNFEGYQRNLHEALGSIFSLTETLLADDRIESFVQRQGLGWGKVAQGNPFQPLTVMAFQERAKPAAISKYARVLLYAKETKPKGVGFADWVKEHGGIEELAGLARDASANPMDQFEETSDERYERAIATLNQQTLGKLSLATSTTVSFPSSYGRALVREVDGKLEVVGIVPITEEALRSDIFALVPPEAPLVRRKLRDKPHYELFRLCDVAARWFPKIAREDLEIESFGTNPDLPPEEYVKQLQAGVLSKSKKSTPLIDRYSQRSGLRFRYSRGSWHAETVSTHARFAVVECKLEMPLPELDVSKQYVLYAQQVHRIANTFAEIADWQLRVRTVASGKHDASAEGEIAFDEFTKDYAWQALTKPVERGASFTLSRAKLHACGVWFENFRALSKAENLGRLPKMMALSGSDGVDLVVPSANVPEQGDDAVSAAHALRQEASRLAFAPTDALVGLTGDLKDKFLMREDLIRLAGISRDYGTDLVGELQAFSEGISALRVKAREHSITVPLAISVSGNAASIARLVH